jgi:hypothetical protein
VAEHENQHRRWDHDDRHHQRDDDGDHGRYTPALVSSSISSGTAVL